MRKIYLLSLLTSFVMASYSQAPGRFQSYLHLAHQGNVKTIIDTVYDKEEDPDKKTIEKSYTQYDFDREGYVVREIRKGEYYGGYNKVIYKYDANYTPVQTTYYRDSLITKEIKLIREDRYKKEWVTIQNDTISSYRVKQWNPETRMDWFIDLDEKRNLICFGRFEYDEQGNEIKFVREYDSEYYRKEKSAGNLFISTIDFRFNTFNEWNELVVFERYNCDDDGFYSIFGGAPMPPLPVVTKRDEKGNWIEQVGENSVYKRTYIYYD